MLWSEGEFADKACEVQHPMDSPPILPDDVVRAAAWMASATGKQVAAHFEKVLHKWRVRAAELEEDEAALHASMPPHRAKVLKGKRLRLLSEMLKEIGHEDHSLVNDIVCGFRLTGDLGLSGVSPRGATTTSRSSSASVGFGRTPRRSARTSSSRPGGRQVMRLLPEKSGRFR